MNSPNESRSDAMRKEGKNVNGMIRYRLCETVKAYGMYACNTSLPAENAVSPRTLPEKSQERK